MGEIISFTGAQGTGKTTATYQKAAELKICYPHKSIKALCDLEHACPFPINKETTREAQAWIFSNQIRQELSSLAGFDIVVTDRTIVDVIAYTQVAGFHSLTASMVAFAESYISIYRQVTFRNIATNELCYSDGIREADDQEFRSNVENALEELWAALFPGQDLQPRIAHV